MSIPPFAPRRRQALALLAALGSTAARAQTGAWPAARSITWVVPFPPGGSNDVAARLLTEPLRERLGQSVVVDNKPGANGSLGAQAVLRAPADGYTWLVASDSVALWPVIRPDPGWDLLTSFRLVTGLALQPVVMVTSPATGLRTLDDLRARARGTGKAQTFASSGQGSVQHLVGELAAQELGIDLMHVPYKGGGQAVTDVISGQVTAGVLGAAAVMPHLRSGKLVALAQTTRTRSAMLAQTPTLAELGARSIDVAQWSALFVPREVDEAIARRMATAVRASLAERTVQERLAANSMDVAQVDPQQFAQQLAQERVRWGQLIKDRRLEVN